MSNVSRKKRVGEVQLRKLNYRFKRYLQYNKNMVRQNFMS